MTSYLLWHLVRICVFREAWPCPARANIWFIPLSTGSDQSDSCALASFAWNPPDNQCATLIHNKCMPRLILWSVVSTIKPHFYSQHFIHLSGISRYMLGYRSSPKLSCQRLSGMVSSETRVKNMDPRCWPDSASSKFCTEGFSKNSGVLHSLKNLPRRATGSMVNSAETLSMLSYSVHISCKVDSKFTLNCDLQADVLLT